MHEIKKKKSLDRDIIDRANVILPFKRKNLDGKWTTTNVFLIIMRIFFLSNWRRMCVFVCVKWAFPPKDWKCHPVPTGGWHMSRNNITSTRDPCATLRQQSCLAVLIPSMWDPCGISSIPFIIKLNTDVAYCSLLNQVGKNRWKILNLDRKI